jgi:L-rhamnose mutarotase
MKKLIRSAGIKNYSIFFRQDGTLFSYYESDLDEATLKKNLEEASKTDTSRKWQEAMEKYFVKQTSDKIGPETISLDEVFHID